MLKIEMNLLNAAELTVISRAYTEVQEMRLKAAGAFSLAETPVEQMEAELAPVRRGRKPRATPVESAPAPVEVEQAPVEVEAAAPAEVEAAAPALKLEDVRGRLAALSQAGKAAEVKALLGEFNAARLTEVDPSNYGALLQRAENL